MTSGKRSRKSRIKTAAIIAASLLFIAAAAGCIYAYSLLSSIKRTEVKRPQNTVQAQVPQQKEVPAPSESVEPIEEKAEIPEPVEEEGGITNIILFGLDGSSDETCRTDTMIILTLDKDSKTIKLSSILRDTYVSIPGHHKNRINAAYAFGGPSLAIDTINQTFDMDMKYYATVDFQGVKLLIDKLGGVDIDVKESEVRHINGMSKHKVTSGGMQHLDGEQTLAYMRIRKDGSGDKGRAQRQRSVLSQLYDKVKKAGILGFPSYLSIILPYVETNLSNGEILENGLSVLKFKGGIEQFQIPVNGKYHHASIDGRSVVVCDFEENIKELHQFIYDSEKVPE